MFEQINELIDVVAEFKGNKLLPVKFIWHSKEFIVKKLNLAYSKREGRGKFYYFAVSDGANYFKLQFNAENLNWVLLETYVE